MAQVPKVSLGGGQQASFDGDTLILKGRQGASIDLDSQAYDNVLAFDEAQNFGDRQLINNDTQAFWDTFFSPEPRLVLREGGVGEADFIVFGAGDLDQLNQFIVATNPDFLL